MDTAGTIHATQAEAIAVDNAEYFAAKVDAFIASKEWNRGQDTRAKGLITEYLAWESTQPAEAPAAPSIPRAA
jgi:hypothetical protein